MPTSVTGPRAQAMTLALIKRASRNRPVSVAELQAATGLTARDVKGVVHALRYSYAQPIGSLRDRTKGGYFLCTSQDDIEATCRPLESQAREMLRLCAIVRKKSPAQVLAEQLGLFAEEAIAEPVEPAAEIAAGQVAA